jgi:hypothetical protein
MTYCTFLLTLPKSRDSVLSTVLQADKGASSNSAFLEESAPGPPETPQISAFSSPAKYSLFYSRSIYANTGPQLLPIKFVSRISYLVFREAYFATKKLEIRSTKTETISKSKFSNVKNFISLKFPAPKCICLSGDRIAETEIAVNQFSLEQPI